MFNKNKQEQNKQKKQTGFPPFLKPVELAVKQQHLNNAVTLLTMAETLFRQTGDTHGEFAVEMGKLAEQVRTNPAHVESELRKIAQTLPMGKDVMHTAAEQTRQFVETIGGRPNGSR